MRLFILVIVGMVFASTFAGMTAEAKLAIRDGAVGRYSYHVVDDTGKDVSNAQVHVWFSSYGRPQDKADWLLETDVNGMLTVEHRFNEKISVGVDKEGYYHTHDEVNYLQMKELPVKDGKWQPYGETRTVVLKRIKTPIQMSVPSKSDRRGYPEHGKWTGYDLAKHDWVTPDGNGICADMKIRFVTQRFEGRDFARTMEVSFADIPYGGAYLMDADESSEFKTAYAANTNASYLSEFKFEFRHKGRELVYDELKAGQYLVFRTRTEVNPDGTLKSAHYGVIMGEWKFFERYGMSISKILFNPTPNDTNLEDAETARRARLSYRQRQELEWRRKNGLR